MVGRSPSLGWSPPNYELFYRIQIRLLKILTGQEFDSAVTGSILSKLLGPYYLGPVIFVGQHFCWKKLLLTQTFLDQNLLDPFFFTFFPKYSLDQKLFSPAFLGSILFSQIFLGNIFCTQNFWRNFILDTKFGLVKKNVGPKSIQVKKIR